MNYHTDQNDDIIKKFIEQNVVACVTDMVDYILIQTSTGHLDDAPFTIDDIENNNNSDLSEVLEWWIVSDHLADKLKEHGEIVLKGYNCLWGRKTSGIVILLDKVMGEICEEMKILHGQMYDWSMR